MAFSTNGASNGTIMGNADALKGDSASLNTITGSVPINKHVTSGSLMGPGVLGKKHGHDDEEQGKLFVGGLSWDTAQDSLLQYFGRFGEVIDCVVMKNAETGRSRGFGFVTFSDPANVEAVIESCPHQLDGRTIDPKSCNPRSLQKPKRSNYLPKIFLGGLPSSITETDLRSFFSRYGEVCEVVIMYDQEKKKSRGFGFLSFADESACSKAVSEHFVNIQNKQVEIKRAEPRTMQGGNSTPGKDAHTHISLPQWPSIPNGHPRHLPSNYGVPNIPPPSSLHNPSPVSVSPHTQTIHGWGITNPTVPPPIHGGTIPGILPTGAPINSVMSPHTPSHPPPTIFPTQYTSPCTTPHASSPVAHSWLQPPPGAASRAPTTTPQPLMPHNNWATVQPSAPTSTVPMFASPLPVASPVNPTAQPYQGATNVYTPVSTPQPSFWGMVPVPTPPPTSHATAIDPYASHPPPIPVASSHTPQQQKVAYSQYGSIAVSTAPMAVQHPVYHPIYQQPSIAQVHPVVSMTTPSSGKTYVSSTGVEYFSPSGSMNHNSTSPFHPPGTTGHGAVGGILVASPAPASQFSQTSLSAASGVVTVPSASDLNSNINGSLGPQRGVIYNQPSQIPGYHPYRRM